jgi:hypothetical protein
MDHQHVEANGLIDLYRRGALPPEEEARFEEHFFGCPECTAQLEAARGFQTGLKAMAAEDAARTAVQAGLLAWLLQRGRLARICAALAVLLAAALPALWLLGENRELRRARAAQDERIGKERQAAADRLAESERRRREERRELEDRLAAARKPELPAPATPRPLVPAVFLLTAVRGEPDEAATIDLGKTSGTFSLAVDPGASASYETYRITITDARGRRAFRQEGLRPNALEVLMITFPASSFPPGTYRLALEGLRPDGTSADLGGYPFRIVR